MDRADFELRLGNEREAAATLEHAWARSPLRNVVKPLMKVARLFHDVEARSEPSRSFYEMF
jgi:hypothetical protein